MYVFKDMHSWPISIYKLHVSQLSTWKELVYKVPWSLWAFVHSGLWKCRELLMHWRTGSHVTLLCLVWPRSFLPGISCFLRAHITSLACHVCGNHCCQRSHRVLCICGDEQTGGRQVCTVLSQNHEWKLHKDICKVIRGTVIKFKQV